MNTRRPITPRSASRSVSHTPGGIPHSRAPVVSDRTRTRGAFTQEFRVLFHAALDTRARASAAPASCAGWRTARDRRGRAHPAPDGRRTRWTTDNVSCRHHHLPSPVTSRAWSYSHASPQARAMRSSIERADALDLPVAIERIEPVHRGLAPGQITLAPLTLRHRMSLWPSPVKSPIPATCHPLSSEASQYPGALPPGQITLAPLLLRHRMSLRPSPVKSPIPATCHPLSSGASQYPGPWPTGPDHVVAVDTAPQNVALAVVGEIADPGHVPPIVQRGEPVPWRVARARSHWRR